MGGKAARGGRPPELLLCQRAACRASPPVRGGTCGTCRGTIPDDLINYSPNAPGNYTGYVLNQALQRSHRARLVEIFPMGRRWAAVVHLPGGAFDAFRVQGASRRGASRYEALPTVRGWLLRIDEAQIVLRATDGTTMECPHPLLERCFAASDLITLEPDHPHVRVAGEAALPPLDELVARYAARAEAAPPAEAPPPRAEAPPPPAKAPRPRAKTTKKRTSASAAGGASARAAKKPKLTCPCGDRRPDPDGMVLCDACDVPCHLWCTPFRDIAEAEQGTFKCAVCTAREVEAQQRAQNEEAALEDVAAAAATEARAADARERGRDKGRDAGVGEAEAETADAAEGAQDAAADDEGAQRGDEGGEGAHDDTVDDEGAPGGEDDEGAHHDDTVDDEGAPGGEDDEGAHHDDTVDDEGAPGGEDDEGAHDDDDAADDEGAEGDDAAEAGDDVGAWLRCIAADVDGGCAGAGRDWGEGEAASAGAFACAPDGGLLWRGAPAFARAAPDADAARAWGRLAAEAVDSAVGADGARPAPCRAHFGRLLDAIACLAARGAAVEVATRESAAAAAALAPRVAPHAVRANGAWDAAAVLSDAPRGAPDGAPADHRLLVAHAADRAAPCAYEFRVTGGPPPPADLLPPAAAVWGWVVRARDQRVRVALLPPPPGGDAAAAPLVVARYVGGVLWEREEVAGGGGARLLIDADAPDAALAARRPPPPDAGARAALEHALLVADLAPALSRSALARALAAHVREWRESLGWRAARAEEGVRLVADERVADEFTALMDARVLLEGARRCERVEAMALAALRRMQPLACTTHADYRASVIGTTGVVRVRVLPASAARVEALARAGALRHFERACAHGALHRELADEGAEVLLPHDATATTVTLALAALLSEELRPALEGPELAELPREIALSADATHAEGAPACDPADRLVPYRVLVDAAARCVRLERDLGTPARVAREASSVDALDERALPVDADRRKRALLRALFPYVVQRMEACECDGVPGACAAQVQARRLAREWRLDGFDAGRNLSSLGLSVLLALLLQLWSGARARVYVARSRAAVVGVHAGGGAGAPFALYDPAQTTRNAFDVVASTLYYHRAHGAAQARLRRGMCVEVWCRSMWATAKVLHVDMATETLTVLYLGKTSRRDSVAMRTQLWRTLSPDSDVGHVLRGQLEQRAAREAGDAAAAARG